MHLSQGINEFRNQNNEITMKRVSKIRRVEITWVDSTFEKSGWDWLSERIEETREQGLEPMTTIGYLLDRNKESTYVCQSLHLDPQKRPGFDRGSEFFKIPTVCVKKIKFL